MLPIISETLFEKQVPVCVPEPLFKMLLFVLPWFLSPWWFGTFISFKKILMDEGVQQRSTSASSLRKL